MITMFRPLKSTAGLVCLLLIAPALISGTYSEDPRIITVPALVSPATPIVVSAKEIARQEATTLYQEMKLKRFGLSAKAFEFAWQGYRNLLDAGKIRKKDVLSICDFSQSSRRKRLYIIDVAAKKVLVNTYVAHGRRSGGEYARSFSNSPESHKSSLGFYRTKSTYFGSHGLALNIEGLEKGINDKADARNIVVHGSAYVGANYLRSNKFNGRSFGCPAVPAKESARVIHSIKGGSCLFIYHPTKNYLSKSKILND